MDMLTISGVIIALLAISGGQYLEGGQLSALINLPAFIIVFGGTLGALMVQTPLQLFLHAMRLSSWVIAAPVFDSKCLYQQIVVVESGNS